MTLTVYKLVHKQINGELVSSVAPAKYQVQYQLGVLQQHPNMFVFGSLEAAKGMLTNPPSLFALWECSTSRTRPAPRRVLRSDLIETLFNAYWEYVRRGYSMHEDFAGDLIAAPEGTVLVDDLLLIREVPRPWEREV